MISFKTMCAGAVIAACLAYAPSASAQATRTWVSGVGDDVNPCSRTAPCKTFAGAISKTAAGGEINCLDPGGFGAVTIVKSITISCLYTEGGVLAGGNGIVINAAATDVIYLRGLDIFGVNPPSNGVRFLAGGALHIENSTIRNFDSTNSFGVSFQPSGSAELFISDTLIADNGLTTTGGGILIQPTGAAGRARVVIKNVKLVNNAAQAIRLDTTGNTGAGNQLTIADSVLSGNGAGLLVVTPASTTSAVASVQNSIIAQNAGTGILANGGTAQVRVLGTTITANGAGGVGQGGLFSGAGANIVSYGDNVLFGNAPDGAFTATLPKN